MLYETTITETQLPGLTDFPAARNPLALPLRTVWALGKFVLVGLLLMYLVGWAQDFERVRRLEAEPAPPLKIISKYQAWERIYRAPTRRATWTNALLSLNRQVVRAPDPSPELPAAPRALPGSETLLIDRDLRDPA